MTTYKYILIDDTHRQDKQPSLFKSTPISVAEAPDKCALIVQYHAPLTDPELRPQLLALLSDLRSLHPEAKVLALDEYGHYHTRIRNDMNALRKELSNLGFFA